MVFGNLFLRRRHPTDRLFLSHAHFRGSLMDKVLVLFVLFFLSGRPSVLHAADHSSDEPEVTRDSTVFFKGVGSYEEALRVWKTPEDIRQWVAGNFSYDTSRAIRLSESQRMKNERFSIYSPSEFFDRKAGVCVDLARFGVETLRRINPLSDPKYLMIEFDAIQLKGNTLRLHWLASFKRDDKTYFFCDSKRPGDIAGPYNDTQEFIKEYEHYRGRKVVTFREVESYQKQRRTRALNRETLEKP
jgi:hypothetical protein